MADIDRKLIALSQPHEVRYWTRSMHVSADRLREAVNVVGNSAEAVREYLRTGEVSRARSPGRAPRLGPTTKRRAVGVIALAVLVVVASLSSGAFSAEADPDPDPDQPPDPPDGEDIDPDDEGGDDQGGDGEGEGGGGDEEGGDGGGDGEGDGQGDEGQDPPEWPPCAEGEDFSEDTIQKVMDEVLPLMQGKQPAPWMTATGADYAKWPPGEADEESYRMYYVLAALRRALMLEGFWQPSDGPDTWPDLTCEVKGKACCQMTEPGQSALWHIIYDSYPP